MCVCVCVCVRPHPKTASAAAVAYRAVFGATVKNADMSAVTEHPAAVMSVSISTPLSTASTVVPSVTYR